MLLLFHVPDLPLEAETSFLYSLRQLIFCLSDYMGKLEKCLSYLMLRIALITAEMRIALIIGEMTELLSECRVLVQSAFLLEFVVAAWSLFQFRSVQLY